MNATETFKNMTIHNIQASELQYSKEKKRAARDTQTTKRDPQKERSESGRIK
jgi:hypothetical protein